MVIRKLRKYGCVVAFTNAPNPYRSADRARLGVGHPSARQHAVAAGMVCCDRDQTRSIKATILAGLPPGGNRSADQTNNDRGSGHDRAAHPVS